MKRLVVLISGRGSNLQAIQAAIDAGTLMAEVALVVSNRADAAGLTWAAGRGLATRVVASKGVEREAYDRLLMEAIDSAQPDLVVLAGFLRLLTPAFVEHYRRRLVNIHPSLLPAFPGLHAQRQAMEYGVKIAGCTVHFVTEDMDAGPIILQAAVAVEEGDDEDRLAARILAEEHRIYPEAIALILAGKVRVEGRQVRRA